MTRMKKLIALALCALILIPAAALGLSGCGSSGEIDTTGMILVVYDGNGGYLGNKSATVRKLFCNPGSKIPDYPVDYSQNQYTVPSLGLANKNGYQLLGWYRPDDVEYSPSATGEYVYLDTAAGNGVYSLSASGSLVRGFSESPDGDYVELFVEDANAEEGQEITYIFLNAAANPGITVPSGFYVCTTPDDIASVQGDELKAAYEKAFDNGNGAFRASEVETLNGMQLVDSLPDNVRPLTEGLPRFALSYRQAQEGEEELDHYELRSDYAALTGLFAESPKGEYVLDNGRYRRFDPNDPEMSAMTRLTLVDRYVFNEKSADTPADLPRFSGAIRYWDFASQTVTEDKCTWDGEKNVMTLYAHWALKNTVYYHYENGTGQVDESTTRLLADNITYMPLRPGEVIGRKEIVPLYAGHTFVGWSKSQTEYDPWNFENDVFPEGEARLDLYAYYIEGDYVRVFSEKSLASIGADPSGKYLLVEDIDLGGKEYTSSPLGLADDSVFTGELVSFGKGISNFTLKVSANKRQLNDPDLVMGAALFPQTSGAVIRGLKVEGEVLFSGMRTAMAGSKAELKFYASGLVGRALDGTATRIEDCGVRLICRGSLESDNYTYLIALGDLVAYEGGAVQTGGCVSQVENELTGAVEITYTESAAPAVAPEA